ncbi:MAG: hypothetical protein AB1657_04205 [Candidatus Micrarchaeota archaeon]
MMWIDLILGAATLLLGAAGLVYVYYAIQRLEKGELKGMLEWVFYAYFFALMHLAVLLWNDFFPGGLELPAYLLFLAAVLCALQSGRLIMRFSRAYGFAGVELGKDPWYALMESVVRSVYGLEGAEAIVHANSVKGLKVDEEMRVVEIRGNRKKALEELVKKYEEVYGKAALNMMRKGAEAVLRENEWLRADVAGIFGAGAGREEKFSKAFEVG